MRTTISESPPNRQPMSGWVSRSCVICGCSTSAANCGLSAFTRNVLANSGEPSSRSLPVSLPMNAPTTLRGDTSSGGIGWPTCMASTEW